MREGGGGSGEFRGDEKNRDKAQRRREEKEMKERRERGARERWRDAWRDEKETNVYAVKEGGAEKRERRLKEPQRA